MVKPGYKQTEIGVLPESWETITFEDCFENFEWTCISTNSFIIEPPFVKFMQISERKY